MAMSAMLIYVKQFGALQSNCFDQQDFKRLKTIRKQKAIINFWRNQSGLIQFDTKFEISSIISYILLQY